MAHAAQPGRARTRGRMRPLVVHVVGARPNYMKVAPLYAALERSGRVEQRLVHTGQHYDRLVNDVFFDELPLPEPHSQLGVGSGSHGEQTARALEGLERVFLDLRPDLVVVPGDVNSTLAAALAAVKLHIPVCHLESGLRSFDWAMPEEHNRRLTDHVSSLLLTHCEDANENLAAEGIAEERVEFVGNTMIDSLMASLGHALERAAYTDLGLAPRSYLLVTLHRPALVDQADLLARTVAAIAELGRQMPVVFPVHPRTRERMLQLGLSPNGGVRLVDPQPYTDFVSLAALAAGVVTDSGGVQEETTVLGVPCFTLRESTERPVTITHGTNTLLGLEPEKLTRIPGLLGNRPSPRFPPLWDGAAGSRAAAAVERFLGVREDAKVGAPLLHAAVARRPQ
ncbi:MAG TPA: UDP-N-acetylglucosamine 2-epimerase (non-hydrolyzing) [Gaiellaceae bacterium]|nr:UDP-N-acetylglucosamine 2-epimerase (non-hydrolyzing) [Gaiellaceae bacterium]